MDVWEIAEKYAGRSTAYKDMEIFAIDKSAPIKSIRENVGIYLGESVKVSASSAKEILRELETYGYQWIEHQPTGIAFMAGNANHFLTAVASTIEL
jgi:precorrin-6B methylase 2